MRRRAGMKRIACCLLAAISCAALPAWGGVRPRYGGTLGVAMAAQLGSLDPATSGDAVARARVTPLLFDTLVRVDAEGRGHPQLAVAWQTDRSFKRWQFWLRPGVHFSDGTALTAETVVAALSERGEWKARVDGEFVVIESEASRPGLLAELALARNTVARRGSTGELIGTGPFLIKSFVAGKSLELAANDGSWGGGPFVGGGEVGVGKRFGEQMGCLQFGEVGFVEVGAEEI